MRVTCDLCGKAFSAWDNLIGQAVRCPKCGREMIVPGTARPAKQAGSGPAKRPGAPTTSPADRPATNGSPPAVPPRTVKVTPGPKPSVSASAARGTVPPLSAAPAKPPVPAEPDTAPCPNCGTAMPLNDDLCDECGYHLILRKVIDTQGVHRHNDATGFDRLFKGQLTDQETPENAVFWAQLVAAFFVVFISTFCLGVLGLLVSVGLVSALVIYRLATRSQREAARAAGKQDPISSGFWRALLGLQRAVGWRVAKWPFPKARAYIMNAPDFQDEELEELDDPATLEVLDLEGTQITDAGLAQLEGLKQLKFLVVRRTQVTAAGVKRLQRALPNLWIWFE
jgi:hypothetical protein